MSKYPHGLFSWTDISLPDPAAGVAFYSELFGWDAADQHDDDGNFIYTMFSKDGKDTAGMGELPAEMQNQGIPPMWLSYITVDDLVAAVSAVEANGGSVVAPTMDVMTAGRMALVADPQGAVVALWQAGDHPGCGVFGEHGALTWNELMTRDPQGAMEFWGSTMGWGFDKMEGPMDYWVVTLDGKAADAPYAEDNANGGIMLMDDSFPAEIPPHWMVYFHVDDTDAIAAKLTELGGTVSVPAFDTPAGRIAVLGDPQGGTFSVIAPPSATEAAED